MRTLPEVATASYRSFWQWLASLALVSARQPVSAINGYFMPRYGAKSIGVAGTGVAMPQDRLTAANNPPGMALIEAGLDVSIKPGLASPVG